MAATAPPSPCILVTRLLADRCVLCEVEFTSDRDAPLCPRCQAHEDRVYANDPIPEEAPPPAAWTKAAMRERLGVIGDEDV